MNKENLSTEELIELHGSEYVDHFEHNRSAYKKRLEAILRHIKLDKNDAVCDFGCGNGMLFEEIHDKVGSYAGVDFSVDFINSFKVNLKKWSPVINPEMYNQDIVEFALSHHLKFDKAFTLDFSEHLYDEDFKKIYKAIFNTMKAGGQLIFHTPNGGFFLEWMKNHGLMKQQDQHIGVRNAKENTALLLTCGFDSVEVKYIAHYNVLKYLHPLSYIPIIGKVFKARLLLICQKK